MGDDTADVRAIRCETGFGPGRVLIGGPAAGPPVVLIHGYGASADQWRRLMPWLVDRYRVIAPDLLGFAAAPTPPGRPTAERWAGQVRRLLDGLALPRAVLVGHSLGGLVALTAAHLDPARVAGLVLVDSLGLPQPDTERLPRGGPGLVMRLLRAPGIGEAIFWAVRGRRRLAEALALGAYHDPALAPEDAVATWLDLIHRPGAHRAYVGVVRGLEQLVVPVRAGEFARPTLVIWGAEDRGMPVSLAHDFQRLIPQAEVAIIPGCGHVPHNERPEATAAALLSFLEQLADGSGYPGANAAGG